MKQSILLAAVIFFIPLMICAQDERNITGFIQDEQGNPIAYVNVGIVGTSIGTISEEDGNFSLFLSNSTKPNDLLRFSMIGYKSQSFLIKDLKDEQNITLEEAVFELNEIVIRPDISNKKVIERSKIKGNRNVNFSIAQKPRQNLGSEIGKRFNIKKQLTQIETLKFYIRSNNFSSAKFRISFYDIKDKLPHKNLFNQDILVTVSNKETGWIELDLTEYDLYTENDFIASIQWIDASADGKNLAMPIRFPVIGNQHFYKFGSQAEWRRFKNMSISMTVGLAY